MKRTIKEGVTRMGRLLGLSVLVACGCLFTTGCETMMPGQSQQSHIYSPNLEVPAGARPRNNNVTSQWGSSEAAREIETSCGVNR